MGWTGWTELPSRALFTSPVANGIPRVGVVEETHKRLRCVAHRAERSRLETAGYNTVRGELSRRVASGDIDAGTAGLVVKWAEMAQAMERELNFTIDFTRHLAANLKSGPGMVTITSHELSGLRNAIREEAIRQLMQIKGKKRGEALERMLDLQPDNASKGDLFKHYGREVMKAKKVDGKPLYRMSDLDKPETFGGTGLKNRRTPDDVVTIEDVGAIKEDVEEVLPPGHYMMEYKAGEEAFKIDQAEDYAKRSYGAGTKDGGFRTTPQSKTNAYDGLIYVFSTKKDADDAYKLMRDNKLTKGILDKHPGGIHIVYVNESGEIRPR